MLGQGNYSSAFDIFGNNSNGGLSVTLEKRQKKQEEAGKRTTVCHNDDINYPGNTDIVFSALIEICTFDYFETE